jgi:uncharacterized integral membrane protein
MADPHIQEKLDALDKVTITLYRIGMLLTGLSLMLIAIQQIYYPLWFKHSLIILSLACILQASSLHIYNKSIRWILVSATWFGVWLVALSFASSGLWAAYLGLGALFITLSGIAYKESFCFSLGLLKILPILFVVSWIMLISSQAQWAAAGFIVAAILYLYMAWKKLKMPMHYDLGDRSKYEV